jgi:alkylation response protein AidB-like acyl-CoA dehydrogenase
MSKHKIMQGGGFLIQDAAAETVFTPEELNDEQRTMRRSFQDFYERTFRPQEEEVEKMNGGVIRELFLKVAELGLFMADVAEEDNGLGLGAVSTSTLIRECGCFGSFTTTLGAHQCLGMFPVLAWGTREQFDKYIPSLMDGSFMGAYALTEPESGSDALSAKSVAVLSEDGTHYMINGSKQFISNANWADLYTIFAQVDGEKFTAFLVERGTPGLEIGPEEHKLGLKGSSTCPLIMRDLKVPVDHVLGTIGEGHKIALNALNIGRLNMAFSAVKLSSMALREATVYASERQQFGKSIAEFGLIQHKLGEMAARIYAGDAMAYRIAGMIEEHVQDNQDASLSPYTKIAQAYYEFSIECALAKVLGSEAVDYVIDEGLQIHGGYGFSEEYPMARMSRNARILRLYEGTSEICRLHAMGTILKRASQGELELMKASLQLPPREQKDSGAEADVPELAIQVCAAKKIALHLCGLITQRFPDPMNLMEQQELLAILADIAADLLAAESAVLRALKVGKAVDDSRTQLHADLANIYFQGAMQRVRGHAETALATLFEGHELREQLGVMNGWLPLPGSAIALRRRVAIALVELKGELPDLKI